MTDALSVHVSYMRHESLYTVPKYTAENTMGSLSKYSFGSYVGPINTLTSSGRVFNFFFLHFEILGPQRASTSSHLPADHLEEAGNLSFML